MSASYNGHKTTDQQGAATAEELQELHGLVVRELLRRLKRGEVSAEFLAVARAVLQDCGRLGLKVDDRDRKRLESLYGLLLKRLHEAVTDTESRPSASMLGEVRKFLQAQGITKDFDSATRQEAALRALGSIDLPFNTH